MNFVRVLSPVFALLTLAVACGSGQVQSRPAEELRRHRKIAVTNIQIDLIEKKACILYSTGIKAGKVAIEDYSVDLIHKNMLGLGFRPIERRRIKYILREQARTNSGLYAEPGRIGRILGASAIFTGNIAIRTELEHHPTLATAILFPPSLLYRLIVPNARTTLTFSGRLVSVEDGTILISGETTKRKIGFEMDMVREVVDEFFEDVDELD